MKVKKRKRERSDFGRPSIITSERNRERSDFGPSIITNAHHLIPEDGGLIIKNGEAESRRKHAIAPAPAGIRSGGSGGRGHEQLLLDRRVWRRLPEDMLLRVLSLLLLHKQLELQTVCKSWCNFFRQGQVPAVSSSGTQRRETWVVVLPHYTPRWWPRKVSPRLVALCPNYRPPNHVNNDWGRIEWRWSGLPQHAAVGRCFMGSDGGLVVYYCKDFHSLVVFNPLTKATKFLGSPPLSGNDLAPLFNWDHLEMTMLADPSSSFYQLVLMPLYVKYYMQVYDSRSCNWKALSARNSRSLVYDPKTHSWAKWEGHHFTAHHHNVLDDDLFVLDKQLGAMYTYNARRCMWSTVKTSAPSCPCGVNLALKTVVKCKGRILLVGCLELEGEEGYTVEGLAVWEWKLDVDQGSSAAKWVQMATTPRDLWEPYPCIGPVKIWCQFCCHVALENLICMTFSHDTDLDYDLGNKFWTPLAYDVDGGSWERLPSLEGGTGYAGFSTFQPSWNAVP